VGAVRVGRVGQFLGGFDDVVVCRGNMKGKYRSTTIIVNFYGESVSF
jgi:hypothetical protein